ncbi:threonylcarbamoyl-AMP synthase [Dactylosporangium aurantiacum]|uniref:L-threonylcarbamoyladenylate synthase n=1 Tax=Dactylosporangium aurantiacum TaxID=35754 RepID=A0A9Q9ITU3_9ACTN|nr:L-threonylcarbamoyladenylate synthase [Dactylosporangium aurantiacum]MDG6106085.1 L-threonylcarbamoyladenylate synthase [Dactylosporangium aurantiacum]UWZ59404.1 threonylcarbamoyl-AMP synthase [Dactylosporangium aurantiacum]
MLYDCSQLAERDRGIAAAIEAVGRGDLVVLPTDTVYGIGADAFKSWSVTALNNAKGSTAPVPVLVGSRHTLDGLVFGLPQAARDLVDAFWPGALTIVVEHAPSLQWDLGGGDGTVAVRMPLHPIALEVLRETGPMAVSSANKQGQPAAETAAEARDQLGYAVSVYLEGGPCPEPVASTIISVTNSEHRVLRAGAIPIEKLREVVPTLIGLDD